MKIPLVAVAIAAFAASSHAALTPNAGPALIQLQELGGQQPAPSAAPQVQSSPASEPEKEVVGIGVTLGIVEPRRIVDTIAGSPAEKSGLKAGDLIAEVDGADTAGLTLEQMVAKLRGAKGSVVTLKITREDAAGSSSTFTKAITRDIVAVPQPIPHPSVVLALATEANVKLRDLVQNIDLAAESPESRGAIRAASEASADASLACAYFLLYFQELRATIDVDKEPQRAADALSRLMDRTVATVQADIDVAAREAQAAPAFRQKQQASGNVAAAEHALKAMRLNALRAKAELIKVGNNYLDAMAAKGAKGNWNRHGYPAVMQAHQADAAMLTQELDAIIHDQCFRDQQLQDLLREIKEKHSAFALPESR